ncbi:tetratricopeptide repeat protein [bacterium]|nr:tetratricopeptide repeat protein [bacterium]
MKKFIFTLICLCFGTCNIVFADFAQYYNAGQQYLAQFQYSSAIMEFKKALRINYLDNSARIGLVNSYLARGTYFANKDKDWNSAANDYRAALFYLKYYPNSQDVLNSTSAISNATGNLAICLKEAKFNTSPQNRYKTAKDFRADGHFPEAGYEFAQSTSVNAYKKDSYEQIGDILKILGNEPMAGEYYRKAISVSQTDATLRLKYAKLLDKLGRGDEAVNEYNYALAKSENNPEILLALEKIYREKLELAPNDAELTANLGAILQKENKYDDALQFYSKAGELDPTSVTTRLNLGTLYQQKKEYDSAITAYNSILMLYPDNVSAGLYKAQCYQAKGDTPSAIAAYKKVLERDANNTDAKEALADMTRTSMSVSEYLTFTEQNAKNQTEAADTIYDYALDLHKKSRIDDAILCYKEVLKLDTTNPDAYVNLAIAYKQKSDLPQAMAILQTAKEKFPANADVLKTIKDCSQEGLSNKMVDASEAYNKNDFSKALDIYSSIKPQTYDSIVGIAACYSGLKDDAKALEYYKKAFTMRSSSSDVAYYIAALDTDKENFEEAKYYLSKALLINKNNSRAVELMKYVKEQSAVKLLDKAIDLYDKKQYREALTKLNVIISEAPKTGYAYYYRALISDDLKHYPLAILDYKKAIMYAPDLKVVNYLIAVDYDSLRKTKEALTYYKKYVASEKEENEYKKYSALRIKEINAKY